MGQRKRLDWDWGGTHAGTLTRLAGAWVVHFVIIVGLKIFYNIIPAFSQETSWTLTNISYMLGSYIMFHWVQGIPFDFNAGAFDNLNLWEQIDNGDQYTPAKKFLLAVPVVLFLVSTHYTHYDLMYFVINFLATLAVVIPKLPAVSSGYTTSQDDQTTNKGLVSPNESIGKVNDGTILGPGFHIFSVSFKTLFGKQMERAQRFCIVLVAVGGYVNT